MPPTIEPFYANLGREIRAARTQLGMSQEKLGSSLKPTLTRVSIANIEGGNQRVLVHTLVNIAAALKTDIVNILPKKTEEDVSAASAKIAAELASKLGISESKAKKMFAEKTEAL